MGEFKDYTLKLFGQYNNDISTITKESTDRIFYLLKNNNEEIYYSKKIMIGKFYMIKYDYNGNKLWCPIFVIDDRYKPDIQKRIIYAINIDYLPYNYRILIFDMLFTAFENTIDYNKNNHPDRSLKVDFQTMYNMLKNNGQYDYAITAFDYLKIVGADKGTPIIFEVSTRFLSRFVFINTKNVNLKLMKNLMVVTNDLTTKDKLKSIIEIYESIKDDFSPEEQKEYYKKIRSIEKKYKLN